MHCLVARAWIVPSGSSGGGGAVGSLTSCSNSELRFFWQLLMFLALFAAASFLKPTLRPARRRLRRRSFTSSGALDFFLLLTTCMEGMAGGAVGSVDNTGWISRRRIWVTGHEI